jgi:hypothetical protein
MIRLWPDGRWPTTWPSGSSLQPAARVSAMPVSAKAAGTGSMSPDFIVTSCRGSCIHHCGPGDGALPTPPLSPIRMAQYGDQCMMPVSSEDEFGFNQDYSGGY